MKEHELFEQALEKSKAKVPRINPEGHSLKVLLDCFDKSESGRIKGFRLKWPKSGMAAGGAVFGHSPDLVPGEGEGYPGWEAHRNLMDALEEEADPKYFLGQRQVETVLERAVSRKRSLKPRKFLGGGRTVPIVGSPSQSYRVYSPQGSSVALRANAGGVGSKTGLYAVKARAVMSPNFGKKTCNGRTIKQGGEPSFALTCADRHGVALSPAAGGAGVMEFEGEAYNVRRLTPRECFRLQGFPDELFERAREVCSDAQLYRQAGNAVTATVAYEIGIRIVRRERRTELEREQ